MIQINQVKMNLTHTDKDLLHKIAGILRVPQQEIISIELLKKSIDARKKPQLYYIYSVAVTIANELQIIKKCNANDISLFCQSSYEFPSNGQAVIKERPVIIGAGPAGLFCAYELALHGYRPIVLERGTNVDQRLEDVSNFWNTGTLNTNSNVQFGEGGAGTFSDGKLNTLVKDKYGRNKEVLHIFTSFGAPKEILYENKPHIGTDILIDVVKNMRNEIIRLGGDVRFHAQVTDFLFEETSQGIFHINGVVVNEAEQLNASVVILAIGHSARDTFQVLYDKKVPMEAKSFAVGFRVEHPQEVINTSLYGRCEVPELSAASYKLVGKASNGRGIYSFCMCPGGYVVNASSIENQLAINGMSYHGRNSNNANSAIIVSVTPEDFPTSDPLGGVLFQENLEKKAYELGNGRIPIQTYEDFKNNKTSTKNLFSYDPCMKGDFMPSNLRTILPEPCNEAFIEGMEQFGHKIKGFNDNHTILSGVESRTSSPVRITRDKEFQSDIKGLYPCGEGAGYAGGIMSAAMDGMKIAEKIAMYYQPMI